MSTIGSEDRKRVPQILKGVFAGIITVMAFAGGAAESGFAEGVHHLHIEDFGAVGDGKTNDAPALVAAMKALHKAPKGSELLFSRGKSYLLGNQSMSDAQFDFSSLSDVQVDGRGANLIVSPDHGLARFSESQNIAFRNFTVEQERTPFLQGSLVSVNLAHHQFEIEVDPSFPMPHSESWMEENGFFEANPRNVLPTRETWGQRHGLRGPWHWGTPLEADSPMVKPFNAIFVEKMTPVEGSPRSVLITVREPNYRHLEKLKPGDRFVIPVFGRTKERFFDLKDKNWMFEQSIEISRSANILVEGITFHSARPGIVFGVRNNEGPITIRWCRILPKPGTRNLIASWRDGVHCKNNRIGPVIEGCWFEGLHDDAINMSSDAYMAEAVVDPKTFVMTSEGMEIGDVVGVFQPAQGEWVTGFRVVKAEGRRITLDREVQEVVVGWMRPREDAGATQFYNLSRANEGFVVRGCYFGPSRRHAVLARCEGLIEDNVIDRVSGTGVELSNVSDYYYEGPFPRGVMVRGNTFIRTGKLALAALTRGTRGKQPTRPITGNITIENNRFISEATPMIELASVEDIVMRNNLFESPDGKSVSAAEAVRFGLESRGVSLGGGEAQR